MHEPGWLRVLAAMVAVQFVIGVAFSIVPPILALYLPHLGVATPEAVRRWAGIVVGITPLAAAFTAPLWGRVMVFLDRRSIVLISCAAAACCTGAMSLVRTAPELLALRFCMGLFGGHIAACMAIVSAVAPARRLGFALGALTTAQLSGALLGPLVGGLAADGFHDLRAPFYCAGLAGLMVCPVLLGVPASRQSPGCSDPRHLSQPRDPMTKPATSLLAPVVILLLVQAAIMGPQPIVSLQVGKLLGTASPSATLAGVAFSVVGLSGLLAAPTLGHLGDRLGRRQLLLICLPTAAGLAIAQALARSYLGFVAARFLTGIFLTGVIPLVNAAAVRAASPQEHGRVFSFTSSAAFLGAFVGPLAAGEVAATWNLPTVFITSSLWLLLATAVIARWRALSPSGVDPAQ